MISFPEAMPTLLDGELVLRPWTLDDTDFVYESCQDPAIQEYTTIKVPYARADAEWFTNDRSTLTPNQGFEFCVSVNGERIGSTALHNLRTFDHSVEVGYWMNPEFRGHGYMRRAVLLAANFAFSIGFRRVDAQTLPENAGSQAVLKSAGFEMETILRQAMTRRDGTQTDSVMFAKFPEVKIGK